MTAFYRLMLAWSSLDLDIAKATGRNPKHIEQLQKDVAKWEHALLILRLNA
jgi:hypothetical protein